MPLEPPWISVSVIVNLAGYVAMWGWGGADGRRPAAAHSPALTGAKWEDRDEAGRRQGASKQQVKKGGISMQILLINVLVAGMLLFGGASASAYALIATTNYDGHNVTAGEEIVLTIWLDTQGQSDISTISLGVVFDNTQLTYVAEEPSRPYPDTPYSSPAGFSDAQNYPLYMHASDSTPSTWLEPRITTTGGATYDPPPLIGPNEVAVNFFAANGTPTTAVGSSQLLAELVFHVANPTHTSVFTLSGGISTGCRVCPPAPVTFSAPITVNAVPEPTTVLLIGLGLLGMAMKRRHRQI